MRRSRAAAVSLIAAARHVDRRRASPPRRGRIRRATSPARRDAHHRRTTAATARTRPADARSNSRRFSLPCTGCPSSQCRVRCTRGRDELDDRLRRVAVTNLPRLARLRVIAKREVRRNLVVRRLRLLRVHLDLRYATQTEVAQRVAIDVSTREIPVRAHEEESVWLDGAAERSPRSILIVVERDDLVPSERIAQPLEHAADPAGALAARSWGIIANDAGAAGAGEPPASLLRRRSSRAAHRPPSRLTGDPAPAS